MAAYILQRIRDDYLADSTVTIHLIGAYGPEKRGWYEQQHTKRELGASLYDGTSNTKSGILGVVLPRSTEPRVQRVEHMLALRRFPQRRRHR